MSSDRDAGSEDAVVEAVLRRAAGLLELAMRRSGVDRVELARRLGRTPGFVSHLLTGRRNMTLKTLASVLAALGFELELRLRRRSSP